MWAAVLGCSGAPTASGGPATAGPASTARPPSTTDQAAATGSNGTPAGSAGPSTGGPFIAIAAGSAHTCVIAAAGTVECWGANESGQLGNGTFETPGSPGMVVGLRGAAVALRAGPNYTCAILLGGAVQCWGNDEIGQLGDGTKTNSPVPVDVISLEADVMVIDGNDTGESLYFDACALVRGTLGSVEHNHLNCWGNNDVANITSLKPTTISGLSGEIATFVAGSDELCALFRSGQVKCIGLAAELYYQDGIPKGLGDDVTAIDSGNGNICVILVGGALRCWGGNSFGQLGTGSIAGFTDNSTVPLDVLGLGNGVAKVFVQGTAACAVTDGGALKCWGSNQFGMLGNGVSTSGNSPVPVDVVGLSSGVVAAAQGDAHGCAIADGGSKVMCWGFNDRNQIGQRLVTPQGLGIQWSLVPVEVAGL